MSAINTYDGVGIITKEEHLEHYGILHRSGRYPWGSGSTENVRNKSFLDITDAHRKQGMTDTQIAEFYHISTTQLRAARHIAVTHQRQQKILQAQRLKNHGLSNVAIGDRMGIPESSVRALLAPGAADRIDAVQATTNMLKDHVDRKKYVQIGEGVESQLGITQTRLSNAVARLREQGYEVHTIKVQQLGTGKFTNLKVLAQPGTTKSEIDRNRGDIRLITEHSVDNGRSFLKTQPPISISSRRLAINYGGEGGEKADGVIYVRPGKKDLSIGDNRYGQVRILVDNTHYLKGMAVYKEDLPEGVDLLFNTNKSRDIPLKSKNPKADQILKPIADDPDLPFGSIIRQVHDPRTGKVSSAMNIVGSPTKEGSGVEGSWDTWSRNLPSQMLSKQSPDLAKQQLRVTYERRQREFDEISSLTNPVVRRSLLLKFADSTDSAAVHLKAASLPRQATKVLLPIPSIKSNEIYAPSFRNGEKVALVRFPHGGKFEIPQLTVNNNNREGKRLIGNSLRSDAVGIHHSVAERLSGADFDGDTVLVIPNHHGLVKSDPALKDLTGFDPMTYKIPEGSSIPKIKPARKQQEMGKVSNLITDMSLQGASSDEIARAVKHSMVVIDSEKHNLDFKQSEKDHGILQLKQKYQSSGGKQYGASTLLSRATAQAHVPERKPRSAAEGGPINLKTGEKELVPTGRTRAEFRYRTNPETGKKERVDTGRRVPVLVESKRLAETTNAHTLESDIHTTMEVVYANHSNTLKALANRARLEAVHTKPTPISTSAKKVYAKEVEDLNTKLRLAKENAPRERQAQLLANIKVGQVRKANPGMEKDELNKQKQIALNEARLVTGAKKHSIEITQSEWDAIQAGAISTDKLEKIILHADSDAVKQLALPRTAIKMTPTARARAQTMLEAGYTQAEVADQLGVGLTTLKVALSE